MFARLSHRRSPTRTPAPRRPALFEPLESRQLLSGTVAPSVDAGVVVSLIKSTVPTSVLTASKIKGAITVQLTNRGTTSDAGVNSFVVYASTDAVVDSTDRQLTPVPFTRKLNLKAGKLLKVTIPIKSQAAPPAGTYEVLVATTDASGNTTTTEVTPEPSLTVAAAYVNLEPVVGTVTPTALVAGKTITFKATITNTGNVNSTGTLTTAVGLSLDGANVTIPLTSQSRRATIRGSYGALTLTFRVKIPVGTAPGTYFPSLVVTPANGSQVTAFGTAPITLGTA